MRRIMITLIGIGVLITASPAALVARESDDFEWTWEGAAGADGAVPADAAAAKGGMDPETYNQLLKENLNLRRKLQETDRGSEAMREENARLQREMKQLQSRIAASGSKIEQLQEASAGAGGDPDKVAALEAALDAAAQAKAEMAQELAALKERVERNEARAQEAPSSNVKPGSDLFTALETENAELRTQLSALEDRKKEVVKELREVKSEAAARKELETKIADVSSETAKHKAVIRKLLERIPALEQELAATQSRERAQDAELSRRERELRAVKVELEKREERLAKARRVAALLAKTRSDVTHVGVTRQRDVHYNMGVVYANRGQFKEAEREYLRALRLDPSDADTHYNLGVLYEQNLKKYRKAASHYRRYFRLRPDAPDANEVRLWITQCELK